MRALVLFITLCFINLALGSDNQTDELSPVLSEDALPFTIEIEEASFTLPTGLQGYVSTIYKGKWILLAGRTNGLHGFDDVGNNFPPRFQNSTVYVIDPETGDSVSRSLSDATSGLSQEEIDILSVVAAEFFQNRSTLYVVGGYGINSATSQMETKSTLTAIELDKLIQWVSRGLPSLKTALRQVSHPLLQVTGGALYQYSPHNPFLLILGQNFSGLYRDNSNGIYTQQIRRFRLSDDGKQLAIHPETSDVTFPDYRRRDLNVVPMMHNQEPGYAAFGGVFTLKGFGGVWTVPILIDKEGRSFEPDPQRAATFKQAMNHYNCPAFGLYSSKHNDMYVILPGGISYGFFEGGVFNTNAEIPFINQVTTIKMDPKGQFTQYLINNEYPYLVSTGSNPGNQLLFGAEAQFFPASHVALYRNGVIQLDRLKEVSIIGHIVGGVVSTLPNTNGPDDTTSSPYVFTVKFVPK